ncbi:enzyme of heme biosynthesis [Candidatus Methylacidiphilum infernorum]|uniref:enzyme of heme biosynthesis n=1 Tax=Candidatus Methylacidiphilum infernorum TaxID=511746 RepID=UPI001F5DC5BD|nr:enzyme of heme biosynthesis [Candidatus Methylacidiphilum infernorum]
MIRKPRILYSKLVRFQRLTPLALFFLLPVLVGGCSGEQRAHFAKDKIEEYKQNPTKENKQEAQAALAELDATIYRLEAQVSRESGETKKSDQQRLKELKKQRSKLNTDFTKAEAETLLNNLKNFFQNPPLLENRKDKKNP